MIAARFGGSPGTNSTDGSPAVLLMEAHVSAGIVWLPQSARSRNDSIRISRPIPSAATVRGTELIESRATRKVRRSNELAAIYRDRCESSTAGAAPCHNLPGHSYRAPWR